MRSSLKGARYVREVTEDRKDAILDRVGQLSQQACESKDPRLYEQAVKAESSLDSVYWRDKHGSLRRITKVNINAV